jgi:hypothetical protein
LIAWNSPKFTKNPTKEILKMFSDYKNFYPTPSGLALKMICLIKGHPQKILESQAGKGDLIECLNESWKFGHARYEVVAIEIDEDLQSILRGKNIKVIDSDFLNFQGPDKFDLIIGNPPFDHGEKHLLKAIDILYRGQIIYLLNAETLKNPNTNTKKELVRKLDELGAEIEYIQNAFVDAERPTGVEIALINITVERKVEDDLFAGARDEAQESKEVINEENALSTGRTIQEMIASYNQVVTACTETIISYYRHHNKVSSYLGLNKEATSSNYNAKDLTEKLQNTLNMTVVSIRKNFWRKTLDIAEVQSRLTEAKQKEFEHQLSQRSSMDFTESNIRSFILNIIGSYEQTIVDSVLSLFDKFTIESCYRDTLHEKNIHYFNGWKTNNAFKLGKRLIIPIHGSYGGPFQSWSDGWSLDYQAERSIRDIDMVISYFDGMHSCKTICDALKEGFGQNENSGLFSTHFKITAYKKGTLHLTFLNDDILRRFNIAACKGKGWLPENYGTESYVKMLPAQRDVIDSFEGAKTYEKNLNAPLFPTSSTTLKLAA